MPVIVHIAGTRPGFEGLQSPQFNLWNTLGTMVVDQSATVRIILSGVLADFPDLQIAIAHMGGGIAANKDRFTLYLFTNSPGTVREYVENIRALGLSREASEGVLAGNAARLLGI